MTENNEITENIQTAGMKNTIDSTPAQEPTDSTNVQDAPERKSRHTRPQDGRGRYFVVRQILNLLFMVIALVGVGLYLWWNEMGGIIIVVIAMAFKMAECVLRYLK